MAWLGAAASGLGTAAGAAGSALGSGLGAAGSALGSAAGAGSNLLGGLGTAAGNALGSSALGSGLSNVGTNLLGGDAFTNAMTKAGADFSAGNLGGGLYNTYLGINAAKQARGNRTGNFLSGLSGGPAAGTPSTDRPIPAGPSSQPITIGAPPTMSTPQIDPMFTGGFLGGPGGSQFRF